MNAIARDRRQTFVIVAGVLAAIVVLATACGASEEPTPTGASPAAARIRSTPTPLPPESRSAPAAAPSVGTLPLPAPPRPAPQERGVGYDPNETMFLIFSPPDHSPDQTLDGLGLAQQMQDKSQVPVIIEMLQFLPSLDLVEEAGFALQQLTGEGIAGENLNGWQEWLGEHADEYPPPSRYLSWKINLLSLFDPRFAALLSTAGETSRVNIVEIVWGGVRVDGIPDLNNSPSVPANEADFMNPDDRVFGVSINGEHRAYPHRILNPHEMANDLLGGEPIALAY